MGNTDNIQTDKVTKIGGFLCEKYPKSNSGVSSSYANNDKQKITLKKKTNTWSRSRDKLLTDTWSGQNRRFLCKKYPKNKTAVHLFLNLTTRNK